MIWTKMSASQAIGERIGAAIREDVNIAPFYHCDGFLDTYVRKLLAIATLVLYSVPTLSFPSYHAAFTFFNMMSMTWKVRKQGNCHYEKFPLPVLLHEPIFGFARLRPQSVL